MGNYLPDKKLFDVHTHASGPTGRLPLQSEFLTSAPSGHIFGWTQDAAMGWNPSDLGKDEYLILSTQGGIRAEDGSPIALGYHTGHYEVGLLAQAAANEFKQNNVIPFAGFVSDPCDGRTQGTPGMMDSLAYRNDAATVLRRLIRSLPTRKGVLGIATCDKGLPAMMMALAAQKSLPCVIVPGGVTLLPEKGEDAGKIQSLGSRFAHGLISLEEASDFGCRACASPGGGCQFLGTAATSQVVAEALGLAITHSALAPSGQAIWLDMARRSAHALMEMSTQNITTGDILTEDSIHNAMVTHAAFGGSTNLLLHIPAIAHAARLSRPSIDDWSRINRATPRLVDVIPNGPTGYGTVQVFLAGGVPEVMLHLRELGLLKLNAHTVSGTTLDESLDEWQHSERRKKLRERLQELDGVDPDDVIMNPTKALERGLTSTITFLTGNLAPQGAVIKSTAIDPSVVDADGVYRKIGHARVFTSERAAIAAVKGLSGNSVHAGDIIALIGCGPMGTGMEETYQLTAALKYLPHGNTIALITDARFSGVSTGACIGHIGPEALAGGPLGKLRDGDLIRIVVDRVNLSGSVDLIVNGDIANGTNLLNSRSSHPDLKINPDLPEDTRLWAALQNISGGTWGGCVYDVDKILEKIGGA
ncbi:YjhG/YagF family D-xylonate dehydratase [Candidatus Villigracilis affinis]|uniref:YjhG/YagF family D-xylonate dehydratase n=1 Tax=Candidatus Villigracilis affinis TaxID=3140682 RepID=UPI001D560AFF|nr:YjhG/YagF family D-xylonate dehydratase [Anaerolineales bacterium]